jgi:hypothetical protein
MEGARELLDQIVRNNMAIYTTELNSWSLGYYLNNARFRIVAARKLVHDSEASAELDAAVRKVVSALEGPQESAPIEWVTRFHALRLMIGVLEDRAGPEAIEGNILTR